MDTYRAKKMYEWRCQGVPADWWLTRDDDTSPDAFREAAFCEIKGLLETAPTDEVTRAELEGIGLSMEYRREMSDCEISALVARVDELCSKPRTNTVCVCYPKYKTHATINDCIIYIDKICRRTDMGWTSAPNRKRAMKTTRQINYQINTRGLRQDDAISRWTGNVKSRLNPNKCPYPVEMYITSNPRQALIREGILPAD